ncbi:MAG TPA: hypothetical protein VGC42_13685 [Kofleriaceae bacterium]
MPAIVFTTVARAELAMTQGAPSIRPSTECGSAIRWALPDDGLPRHEQPRSHTRALEAARAVPDAQA